VRSGECYHRRERTRRERTISEKPQKRLVGWKQYIGNIAVRVLGRSFATALLASGILSFGFSVFLIALVFGGADINAHRIADASRYLLVSGLLCGLFLFGWWSAKILRTRVEQIEPVGLITRHNTGSLPAVETLVRSSDLPATDGQTELLRAVRQGAETPPEQLLRATQEGRQDV
jgi:hypothetical protein